MAHNRTRHYTDDEARAIFERALSTQSVDGIKHDDLLAAAEEVGLAPEAVERAIVELDLAHAEKEAIRSVLSRRRRQFVNHLVPFLAVNLCFFVFNWLTTPWFWWAGYITLFWALGLFFHAWSAFSSQVSKKRLRRELRRLEGPRGRRVQELIDNQDQAQRKVRRARLERNVQLLGDSVEEGAAALLERLAGQLREYSGAGPRTRVEDPNHYGSPGPAGSSRAQAPPSEPAGSPARRQTR